MAHQLNWEPGNEGKGVIVDGNVHTWSVDEAGDPHHADYLGLNRSDDTASVHRNHMAFYIKPDGEVGYSVIAGGDDQYLPAQVDPRLHIAPQYGEWNDQHFAMIPNGNMSFRQGSSAFATELKLFLNGYDPQKAMEAAQVLGRVDQNFSPWEPGGYGKGAVIWNEDQPFVKAWKTGESADGEPIHYDMVKPYVKDWENDSKYYYPFWISPDGQVEHPQWLSGVRPKAQSLIEKHYPQLSHAKEWDFTATSDTAKPKPKPERKVPDEEPDENEWEQWKLDWAMNDDGEGRPYPFPPQPIHWRHDHLPHLQSANDLNVQWHHIPEEQQIDMKDPWAKKIWGDLALDDNEERLEDNSAWHDPKTNTLHIGVPAMHHQDIVMSMGLPWDKVDHHMTPYWVDNGLLRKGDDYIAPERYVHAPAIAKHLGLGWEGDEDKAWQFEGNENA